MYYIMLKFQFLYVGLSKTTKEIFNWLENKKKWLGKKREKPGNFKLLDQSSVDLTSAESACLIINEWI